MTAFIGWWLLPALMTAICTWIFLYVYCNAPYDDPYDYYSLELLEPPGTKPKRLAIALGMIALAAWLIWAGLR